ncbi:MAG: hypothetical protein R8K22_06400 [Mariprofundaceae bacterium]
MRINMHFFEFQAQQQMNEQTEGPQTVAEKKELSKNLRIVILAIRLQRLVKSLPPKLVAAERITQKSLADHYLTMELSPSMDSSLKMAERDLNEIERIFKLDGTASSGYVMRHRFERFYDMFVFWLDALGSPKHSNRRMHVLINGLIHAIDNGFRDDPIVIPDLAKAFKKKYKNKNIRDSKEPLLELFSNRTMATYLCLLDEEDNMLRIDKSADPLLMRLKSRAEVGDNVDISINLALPGRIKIIFDDHIKHLDSTTRKIIRSIATSIRESHAWVDEAGNKVVPYILYREGENGPLILTLWQANDGHYRDIPIENISTVPESDQSQFVPYNMPAKLWEQFRQITA